VVFSPEWVVVDEVVARSAHTHEYANVTELPPATEGKFVMNVLRLPLVAAFTGRVDSEVLSLEFPIENQGCSPLLTNPSQWLASFQYQTP